MSTEFDIAYRQGLTDDISFGVVPGRNNQDLTKGGVKHDQDKPRWGLLSFPALGEVVKVMTLGAVKYEDYNWLKGMNYSRCIDAMFPGFFDCMK